MRGAAAARGTGWLGVMILCGDGGNAHRLPPMPARAAAPLPLRHGSHSAKSRRRAGRACGNELSRPGFLDRACDQEGRGVPLPDGRDRAAHHVRAVPQAEQAALPRSPDGCAVGWRWLRARSRRRRWPVEGDGGATSILGGGRPQSSARPLRRPRQDRSSTKPRQAGASEPMTRKARKAARFSTLTIRLDHPRRPACRHVLVTPQSLVLAVSLAQEDVLLRHEA